MGKDTSKRYNIDGRQDDYKVKGVWKKYFRRLRRRELKV